MTAILLIIVIILLFKFVLTSHAAARLPQGTSIVNTGSCGSAGDNFTSGSGIVAGVSEPTVRFSGGPTKGTAMHCNMVKLPGPIPVFQPPIHVTFPVTPPPIRIQQPILPGPIPVAPRPPISVAPIVRPYVNTLSCSGLQIPVLHCGIVTSGGLHARRVQSGKAGCQGCGFCSVI